MKKLEDILIESSKKIIDILVKEIGNDQTKFDEVMDLVYRNEHPISMRAAWLAAHCLEKENQLAQSHVQNLCTILPDTRIDGIKRTFMWYLAKKDIILTEDQLGILTDLAFKWAGKPDEAIAVRAASVEFLIKVLKIYPEIKPEFIAVLESMLTPEASAGIKNKCSRLLKSLKKG